MQQLSRYASNTSTAALLKIGSLNLLLPQGDIRTLESSADVDTIAPALYSVGWITYLQKRWPVYCLAEELALMNIVPPERRACAMIAMGVGYIGIMCDDMIVLKDFTAQRYELPAAMKMADTPILYLVDYEQGIASVCNANRLTAYIGQLVLKV
jgi:hypothetical protein